MKIVSAAIGTTMAGAGLAKLLQLSAYEKLIKDLDWTSRERQAIGAAELAGGLLMLCGPTRRFGVAIVLAASGAALAVEIRSAQPQLAAPRAAIMLGAMAISATR